ncbi:MAG: hypothetical protein ACRC6T_01240 [Sarcina sp.]
MKKRCGYCGKKISEEKTYCNHTCKGSYEKFEKNIDIQSKKVMILVAISLITAFVGKLFTVSSKVFGNTVSNLGILLFFITLVIFPFSTSTTIDFFGVKKSKLIVRVAAVIFAVSFIILNVLN